MCSHQTSRCRAFDIDEYIPPGNLTGKHKKELEKNISVTMEALVVISLSFHLL